MPGKEIIRTGLVLACFGIIGSSLVAITYNSTRGQIAASERGALLRNLHELVPPHMHDNDLYADTIAVTAPAALGSHEEVAVYRARRAGQPVAAVLAPVAPDGYNGDIHLLVAIRYDGTLLGARVIAHRETPGLGNYVESERSDWILGFSGRSLNDPPPSGWTVKRDGGVFDQFTGATITPRAVVKAVFNCLKYYQRNRDQLYAVRTPQSADKESG